jgi:unsaturated rhamnogalacturonyl hydrolase
MAATAMHLWKDSLVLHGGGREKLPQRWVYNESVYLRGLEEVWKTTGDNIYYDFIKRRMDKFITEDGNIRTYNYCEYNIDNIPMGRLVLTLYKKTGEEKYARAARLLRKQLSEHPRTKAGGFWHKSYYPWQMWLDGIYMGQPFYAEFAQVFKEETKTFDDVVNHFVVMEKQTRDEKTGLLYHAWDESKGIKWANNITGCSPHFWSRAIGWYAMSLAEVPSFLPEGHPGKQTMIAIFTRLAAALEKSQDASGCWWQVTDSANAKGNYLEASGSCMFVYALAKGVRLGYLSPDYLKTARKGYEGILKHFIQKDANGQLNLTNICRGAGLGGNPYRDGSYQYYLSEPVVSNDPQGIGAFIMAANEMEMLDKKK